MLAKDLQGMLYGYVGLVGYGQHRGNHFDEYYCMYQHYHVGIKKVDRRPA